LCDNHKRWTLRHNLKSHEPTVFCICTTPCAACGRVRVTPYCSIHTSGKWRLWQRHKPIVYCTSVDDRQWQHYVAAAAALQLHGNRSWPVVTQLCAGVLLRLYTKANGMRSARLYDSPAVISLQWLASVVSAVRPYSARFIAAVLFPSVHLGLWVMAAELERCFYSFARM